MSEGVTIEWPKADVDALFRAMDRARQELNYSNPRVLNAAAKSLRQTLGTSTRIAPKMREIETSRDDDKIKWAKSRGLKAFDVTGWLGKPRLYRTKTFFGKDKTEAKREHARINKSGLAAASWGLSKFSNVRKTTEYLTETKQFTGPDQYIRITNTLQYITDALRNGPQDVNTALERAGRSLMHSIEKQLAARFERAAA